MSNFADKLSGFFGLSNKTKPEIEIEWVEIPAGTFIMGSPTTEKDRSENETQHEVTISAFKMSKYAITFEQYDRFCKIKKRTKPDDENWGRGKQPVINISWEDANSFAEWLGCRLPTEAEWEYACRAGTVTPFNTGNFLTNLQANYEWAYPYNGGTNTEKTYPSKTQAVGTYAANAYGLYDMHGNVWEWCADWYGAYPTTAQTNPTGAATGWDRVFRGGCWHNGAEYCRSARRADADPSDRDNGIGFRVVLVP